MNPSSRLPAVLPRTTVGRVLVFVLAAPSIWCLLAQMYDLCDMRTFTFFILMPATLALYCLAVVDYMRGDKRLWRAVVIGTLPGIGSRHCV